jgi:hypothetical protein
LGYAVHIRRKSGGISLSEWREFARTTGGLSEAGEVDGDGAEGVPVFAWRDARFVWKAGEVLIDDLSDDWCKKLGEVAAGLGAEAVGDDGERYLADGRVDYGDGAQTLARIADIAALPSGSDLTGDVLTRAPRAGILLIALALLLAIAIVVWVAR